MKSFELKAAKDKVYAGLSEQEIPLTTYNLLRSVILKTPAQGFDVEGSIQRFKVLGLIDKFKDKFEIAPETKLEDIPQEFFEQVETVEIEDADYAALGNWVKEMRWNILSNFIIEFVNNFKK